MKAKLTVTIDEELIPKAKRYARKRGLSASLRAVTEETEGKSFSERWRDKFQPADKDDERYQALAKRYL